MLNSMNNLLEIMDKESCSKSEVYLYEEEGRWYAYHRSSKSLSKLSEAALKLKEACFFYGCYVRQGRSRPEQTAERSVVCCPVFRH